MIEAIDPQSIRMQTNTASPRSGTERNMETFSAFMSNAAPASAEAVVWNTGNPNNAALTHAAVTGMAGGSSAYAYPGSVGTGTYYGGGAYSGAGASTGAYGTSAAGDYATAAGGGTGGAGIDPVLFTQAIRDMNVEMLVLQEGVQREARHFQTFSNVEKTKHETARNTIQNMRA